MIHWREGWQNHQFLLKIKILFGLATFFAESFLLSERFYIGMFKDIYSIKSNIYQYLS